MLFFSRSIVNFAAEARAVVYLSVETKAAMVPKAGAVREMAAQQPKNQAQGLAISERADKSGF